MNLVLATPLYPPDTTEQALYAKRLAGLLAERHAVTIVAYARLPEQIPGVRIIAVDKRRPLPLRLAAFTRALLSALRSADVLIIENGASVELPAIAATLFVRRPMLFHRGDDAAHARAERSVPLGVIERMAAGLALAVVSEMPVPRPEVLPLEEYPHAAMTEYEASWKAHAARIESLLSHD